MKYKDSESGNIFLSILFMKVDLLRSLRNLHGIATAPFFNSFWPPCFANATSSSQVNISALFSLITQTGLQMQSNNSCFTVTVSIIFYWKIFLNEYKLFFPLYKIFFFV